MLNVLAVAGFMTFWAKCNTRSVQAAGPEAPADGRRPRGNGTAQGPGVSHEVLLKRLSSLEDVVYRQLNGKEQCNIYTEITCQPHLPQRDLQEKEKSVLSDFPWTFSCGPDVQTSSSSVSKALRKFFYCLILQHKPLTDDSLGLSTPVTLLQSF